MIDFTSALYLGLQHATETLQPWRALTTGVPAALDEPVAAREIAVRLARLQGFAAAALAPSTLHLAWDVFGLLSHERITVHMDAGAYSISRWGATRAMLRGVRVREFRHHDVQALHAHVENDEGATRPVVVTDGFCPTCGRAAPLAGYLAEARARGGWLVVDDTQALGIFGKSSSAFGSGEPNRSRSRNRSSFSQSWEEENENEERERSRADAVSESNKVGLALRAGLNSIVPAPKLRPARRASLTQDGSGQLACEHGLARASALTYDEGRHETEAEDLRYDRDAAYGRGGGGSFQAQDVHGPECIVIASLAKAFGVPLAMIAGSGRWIAEFKTSSSTRVHCSPPSAADVSAGGHALECNAAIGDERRGVLEQRVRQFRHGLHAHGISASGGLFPVQTLAMRDPHSTLQLHEQLRQRGVHAVPVRGHDRRPRLSFLITARHSAAEIEEGVRIIAAAADVTRLAARPT